MSYKGFPIHTPIQRRCMGNFLLLHPAIGIRDLGLLAGFGSQGWNLGYGAGLKGWDLGLEADIWALRLIFKPVGWDLGLKEGIWALRKGFGPGS